MTDESSTYTIEDLSQEQYKMILWSFFNDIPEKEWNNFVYDLTYKNRFASSHKVIDVITRFSGNCTVTIPKEQDFYRARIYYQDPLRELLSTAFKYIEAGESSNNHGKISEYFNMLLAALKMSLEKGDQHSNEIVEAYNNWQSKLFKGYDEKGSGAPPADNASAGRINPEKIRYLYLAEDPQTAVYEVKPTIGQHVSVATFKTIEEIKIYDLTQEFRPYDNIDYSLFNVIRRRFSEPNTGDAYKYLPTQYLGELIKHMGFDGLRFKSSIKSGGINIVLFDDKKCKAICSDLIKVDNIELKLGNADIYQLGELIKKDKTNKQ